MFFFFFIQTERKYLRGKIINMFELLRNIEILESQTIINSKELKTVIYD